MHNSFDDLIEANQNCCSKSKVASENGKRFEIDSNEEFTRIRIDDCLISSQQVEKCDFGFVRHFNNEFYFVELKGKDVKKALNQIISTISVFESTIIKIPKEKRFGFIVSSRNPLLSTETNNLKQAFAKNYGRLLEIKSVHCKYISK
ncbi:hypothetical protein GKZ90_0008985 [Flavobacterium sp. MC2016-06]|jgi:uncharacterized protein YjbI with pentapeptide repeats|uniref:hypothetical protein n=1 Tax=Flavobacterium sp. MC2016-06 TaxID=2676308 RepID=UPI0012BA9B74|nr:hypothetical protein [Flavobacterium sp. MC2016-06]MBU3859402.1 hypothetical protein [Flavobacterium sp. MC2016-06]